MRYGNYYHGLNINFPPFFTVVILILVMAIFFLVLNPKRIRPEYARIMGILKIRYANNELNTDDYYVAKSILDDNDSDHPAIIVLQQRYAKGDLSTNEYLKMRDNII